MSNNNNKKKAWIKGSAFSSVVLATTFLAACGGGGSSTSPTGPSAQTVEITYPAAGMAITNDNKQAFSIAVSSCNGLNVDLNGTDVTSAFPCKDDVATASFNQLKGYFLDSGTTNTLKAFVTGSSKLSVNFTADFAPSDLIITSVKVGNKKGIPKAGNEVVVNGVTRKGGLSSLTDNVGTPFASSFTGKTFNLSGVIDAVKKDVDTTPDFSFVATYSGSSKVIENYAANGRQFESLGGIQINNSIYTQELKAFLGKVVGATLKNNIKQTMRPAAQLCQLFSENKVGLLCWLNVLDLLKKDGDENLNVPVDISIKAADLEKGFVLEAIFYLAGLGLDVEFPLSNGTDIDRTYTTTIVFDSDVELILNVFVEYKGGEIVLRVPESEDAQDSIIIKEGFKKPTILECKDGSVACTSPQATPSAVFASNLIGRGSIAALFATNKDSTNGNQELQKIILDNKSGGKDSLREVINGKSLFQFGSSTPSVINGGKNTACDSSNRESDVVCQTLTLSGGDLKGAKDQNGINHGGFIPFGGGTQLSFYPAIETDPSTPITLRPMIGSLMNIYKATFSNDKKLSNNAGAVIAISENMLNQMLMAAFQTPAFDGIEEETPKKDENGNSLEGVEINKGVYRHLSAKISFGGMPTLTLSNAINGIKLNTPQINVLIKFADEEPYTTIFGTIKKGDVLIEATIDVETELPLSVAGGIPSIAEGSSQANLYVDNVDVVNNLVAFALSDAQAKVLLYSALPKLLASGIESSVNKLLAEKLSKPTPYNIEKLLSDTAVDELHEEALRSNLPTYKLVLPAVGGIKVDDESRSIHFSGNVEGKDTGKDDSKSLFSLEFYSDRCIHQSYWNSNKAGACKEKPDPSA